jgi:hypothetical protein
MVSMLSGSGLLLLGRPSDFFAQKAKPTQVSEWVYWQTVSKILSVSPHLAGTGTRAATTTAAANSVLADGEHQSQCSKAWHISQLDSGKTRKTD